MEAWQLDFEWLRVKHFVKDKMCLTDLPNLKAILLLIGVQESGILKEKFTKEEKQDLMHVAVCSLLEADGFYEFKGRDHDGWPHWNKTSNVKVKGADAQEELLKRKVIEYFDKLN